MKALSALEAEQSPACFADDINGWAGEEEELAKLVERLDFCLHSLLHRDQCWEDQIDDNTRGINKKIKVNVQKLETVTSFKYVGSVVSDKGSKPEILSLIAKTTAALTRLKPVLNDSSISLSSKTHLMCSLVISTFLCAFESWTLTAELQRKYEPWK